MRIIFTMSTELLVESCRNVVRQLRNKYAWTLLDEEGFVRQLLARSVVAPESSLSALRALALNIYSMALYDACNGSADLQRQRAREDLFHYLYAVFKAKHSAEAMVMEVVQAALVRIMEQCQYCREPGAFLYFCLQRLRHAEDFYQLTERRQREIVSWPLLGDETDEGDDRAQVTDVLASRTGIPQLLVECKEVIEQLFNAFQQIYTERRRAQRQLDVIYYTFFKALSDREIAELLETTEAQVQVLRSRGLDQIRPYPTFLQLLRDWVTNCKNSELVVLYQ